MTPDIKERYLAYLTREQRGPLADRIAHWIMVGFLVLLGLLGCVLMVLSVVVKDATPITTPLPIGLVGAVLLHLHRKKEHQKQMAAAERSVPIDVLVILANTLLFQPGRRNQILPCSVLFSFHEAGRITPQHMETLAMRMSALSELPPAPEPALHQIHSYLFGNNQIAVPHRRMRVPESFTGGPSAFYLADLHIRRRDLEKGYLTQPWLSCMVEPGETGRIELIPWQVIKETASSR